ncbi:MAG: DUF3667 domain-containing protein [Acidobacteria bacterium]|nr:DUF3667 domain-containing protein [Acidobacteriota bacterium]
MSTTFGDESGEAVRVPARQDSTAREPAAQDASGASCANCGEPLTGDYCCRCGEKSVDARDLSVRHFVAEAAQELTSVEHSKLFRTIYAVLFKPGFLTAEYFSGRRGLYLKPLNLCLAVFAVQLFAYTAYKQVSTYDIGRVMETQRQLAQQWKLKDADILARRLEGVAARKRITPEALYESINEKWNRNASLVQIPQIVLLALLLHVVYLFRRYFIEHLVFSLHFLSFTALTLVLMWPVYFVLGINPTLLNMLVALAKFLLDIFYLFVAARVFYRESVGKALLRAPVIFVGYFVIYIIMYNVAMLTALRAATRP